MKKKMALWMSIVLVVSSIIIIPSDEINASKVTKKVTISKKKVSTYVGEKVKIKLKNVNKKVKWSVGNKKIAKIVKRKGKYTNTIVIKALKKGTTKIKAKYKKKTYTVKIKVKKKTKKDTSEEITKVQEVESVTTNVNIENPVLPEENITTSEQNNATTSSTEVTTTTAEEPTSTNEVPTTINGEGVQMSVQTQKAGIEISIVNYTDDRLYIDYAFGKLEKYENGEWRTIPYTEGGQIEPIEWLEKGIPSTVYLSINDQTGSGWAYFDEEIGIGHYRYSHKISSYYSEPTWITGEFDIK